MDEFCGSKFWDLNVTWYTKIPDLTPCFEKTVLVWVPSVFLWIFAGYEVFRALRRTKANASISCLHISILTFTFLLFLLNLTTFVYSFVKTGSFSKLSPVDHVAPVLKATTYLLALSIQALNRQRGVFKSGVVFLFWFLAASCGLFEFQTVLRNPPLDDYNQLENFHFISSLSEYPLVVIVLLLLIINDSSAPEDFTETSETNNKPCPKSSATLTSLLTFHWIWPLIQLGYKKPLEFTDLWNLSSGNKTKNVVEEFQSYWKPAFRKCQQNNLRSCNDSANESNSDTENLLQPSDRASMKKIASIIPALWSANWKPFMFGSLLILISSFLMFVTPKLLELVIEHVNSDEEMWKGILYAILMLITRSVDTFLQEHYFMLVEVIGLRTRGALAGAVYQKSLVISNAARQETTTGEIVNLMSIDSQKLSELMMYINGLWTAPLQIVLALYFMYQLLGVAIFAGIGVLVLLVPISVVIANWRENFRVKQMENKDQRIKLMSEILAGIKVLKFYAWEPSFENAVEKVRKRELNILKKEAYVDSFNEFLWYSAPFMVILVTFATYVLMDPDNVLDARKAFVALNLFNMIRMPLSYLPYIIVLVVQAKVSVDRLNKFFNADEIDWGAVSHVNENDGSAIAVENGFFCWNENPTLRNINFKIQQGSLVAVVGIVGSGKSSLLSAILGEMGKQSGRVNTQGSIAYVAQQAWIQNDTVRGNVLFGRDYDFESYNHVIQACALQPDLDILPAGDKTEIGEKGINLSGGQKQRVALARAVYNSADVYLLDDPLSAVDSHVGKHIFEEVIGPNGILRGKTRVLVTHGLTYLPQVDCIFVMKNGEISEIGTFQELLHTKGAFADFLVEHLKPEDLEDIIDSSLVTQLKAVQDLKDKVTNRSDSQVSENKPREETETHDSGKPKVEEKTEDKLIEEEKAEIGSVKLGVYIHYLKNIGWGLTFLAFLFHVVLHGLTLFSNIWLSMWVSVPNINGTHNNSERDFYLGIYGGLGLGQAVSVFLASLLMALGSLRAAKVLHNQMLRHILRSPMSFFDTTPLGRILNRFSNDVEVSDEEFPRTLRIYLNLIFDVVATFIAIIYSTPLFVAVAIPIGVLYYFIQKFFVATSRQLKRLESVFRSPVFSHFSETLTGVSTIRSFSAQNRFMSEAEKVYDSYQMAYFSIIVSDRWLGVNLQCLGNFIAFFAAVLAIVSRPAAGIVGLSLTYALSLTDCFNWLVTLRSEVETNVVSIERIKEYGENPQEAAWELPEKKPSSDWPQRGQIDFKDYSVRYREGLDLVLKNLSCQLCPGEKVGIVGRTGAGKSSMTLGLFRIIEAAGGSIEIDGVNISSLGLHDIRRNLTIIPQDPVLFAGTLRFNLDPFEKYSDSNVWNALEFAHLKSLVEGFSAGLEHTISEGGENLSVGQRQLVCLARALLQKSKILILDEATAAVDLETDVLIQQTIRTEFQECTVVTIAHRINTVMDYNRVLVLDKGEIKEFQDPKMLLQDPNSIFYSMAKDAGLV